MPVVTRTGPVAAPRWKIALALGVLWLVWGSTYLAVSLSLPALPPFLLSSLRFGCAAPMLAVAAVASGAERPNRKQLGGAVIVGLFLFLGGNGGTVWAQTRIPSGLTAVLVGLVPLWLVVLGYLVEGDRPQLPRVAGVLLGLLGVAGLAGGIGGAPIAPLGVASVLIGSWSWATGSILARRLALPRSIAFSTAAQMAAGCVGLGLAGVATGQVAAVHVERIDALVVACFAWLVLGGSIAALMAYNWLLRVTTPAVATTYAYVNPLVAVWLGWWLGGEKLTASQLACSGAVIGAVVLVSVRPAPRPSVVVADRLSS